MIYLTLNFLLISVTVIYSEDDVRNICFDKKIGNSVCRCELLFPDPMILSDLHSEMETRLTCIGEDSLEMAVESLTFQKRLVFTELALSNGTFEGVEPSDLQHFSDLKNLTLSGNSIVTLGVGVFGHQSHLEHLDLSRNNLTFLSAAFESLAHLKNLTLSNNRIDSIGMKTFSGLHSLTSLDVSGNRLPSVDCGWFFGLKNLQILLLNENKMSHVNGSFHLLHLQHLDLSGNYLKYIQSPTFFRLKSLKFLSLAMNELTTLNESLFKGNINLEKVNLTGNLWVCDRTLLPLNDWLKKYEVYKEGGLCMEPPELRNYTIQHGLDIVYLEVKIEESPTCNRSMCNCSISRDKLVITVDCSNKGFSRLPEEVPYKTRVLNLHNNNIKSLTTDHIDSTQWSDVSFLYLNNNVIDSLKGLEGTWLLRNLVALHLSNNQLTEIPIHILEQFRGGSLDELFLSGNPWNCDCNTVRFQMWMQDNYRAVRNFDSICCSSHSGVYSNQPIYRLKKSQLCPQQVQLVNYLDVLNVIMAVLILIILVKLSYDYWLQKRTGKLPRFFSFNLM